MRSRCSSPTRAARADVRAQLAAAPDLARSLARLVLGRGGPRDLAAIRDGLGGGRRTRAPARGRSTALPAETRRGRAGARRRPGRGDRGGARPPRSPTNCRYMKRDGGFVRAGYDATLDETRALRDESRRVVAALQARYADETGVRALKVRHNNVLGYFVEVTAQHGEKLLAPPLNATFIHRQTLAGQVRFTTTELAALEAKIASAADRALGIELEIFERLAAQVTAAAEPIKRAAEALAVLDVAAALARRSRSSATTCAPRSTARSISCIEGGRHPVVEQALQKDGGPFVANDCDLSPPAGASGRPHLRGDRPEHGRQVDLPAPERADRRAGADGQLRAGEARAHRRGRPAVLARRRRRRSRARALDLHGRDGRDRRDPQPGERARAGDPRRDRARHRDLRRPLDRLGGDRASARDQPLPRAVRDAFPRADRALGASSRGCTTRPCG